jgi:glucose/arabinose dehydrogenase
MLYACNQKKEHQATASVNTNPDSLAAKYHLSDLKLPPGFKISVFAEVSNARSLCWGAKGTLFVGNRSEDKVYAVVDENKDGVADKIYVIAKGLNSPNGVAFKDGNLYVAEISRIIRFDDIENKLSNPPAYKIINDSYPDKEHHGWKFIAFGPDGKLYVPVGAPCNVCDEKDSIFATITRINADGTGREIYAKGIRNSVGFAWQPGTNELWFTDNGRDELGDDIPFCELNHAPKAGMHFGFPYVHQGNILDPEFGKGKDTANYTPPALKVGPHAAPLGMRFYTGNQFPAAYKNNIFIAEHGSWNRTIPYGYEVKLATVEGDKVTKYENFVTGWLKADGKPQGRPVDVIVAADGALLISDDMNGVIYRVSYSG